MATTFRDPNLYKDLLMEAIPAAFAGRKALAGTGAAVLVPNLPTMTTFGTKAGTGSKVQIPYFDSLGELEDIAEGAALTPRLLSSTLEEATMIRSGIAGEITSWARIAAQAADPEVAIAQQFAELAMRRIDRGLITAALGTSLVTTTGVTITLEAINLARSLFGDEDAGVVLMVCHSRVMRSLRNLREDGATGRPLFTEAEFDGNGIMVRLPNFLGIPIMSSDRLTPTGTVYPTLLCKRGSLVAWYNGNEPIETDRDILAATEIQAMHLYHVEHLYKRPANGTVPGVVRLNTTEA
jgi:hypothetical protein